MDSPIVDGIVLSSKDLTVSHLCQFIGPDGAKCQKEKHSRGYCSSHYRALSRAGAFGDTALASKAKRDSTLANAASVKRARRKLVKLAPDFVDHLHRASDVASKTGKANPAIWALLHSQVVEPVEGKTASPMSTSTINIGVKVSGVNDRKGEGE